MKSLRKFNNKSHFKASKCSLEDGCMGMLSNTSGVSINEQEVLKTVINVTSIDSETTLISSVTNGYIPIIGMSIDGKDVEVCNSYLFESVGIHYVDYYVDICDSKNFSVGIPSNVIEITIPKGIENLNEISGGASLEYVHFYEDCKLKRIGTYSLRNLPKLKELIVPNSVITIGECFSYVNSGLTYIHIGDNVESISKYAYDLHTQFNLERITVSEKNKWYDSRDNCNALVRTSNNEIIIVTKNTIYPPSIKYISGEIGCYRYYSSFNFPKTIKGVDVNVVNTYDVLFEDVEDSELEYLRCSFHYNQYYLNNVNIPRNVKYLMGFSFENDSDYKLTTLDLQKIVYIESKCFNKFYAIKTLSFGSNLSFIGSSAFTSSNLNSITFKSLVAPNISGNCFTTFASSGTLYYPNGSDYSSITSSFPTGWTISTIDVSNIYNVKVMIDGTFVSNAVVKIGEKSLVYNYENECYISEPINFTNGSSIDDCLYINGENIGVFDFNNTEQVILLGDCSTHPDVVTCTYSSSTIGSSVKLKYVNMYTYDAISIDNIQIGLYNHTYTFNDTNTHIAYFYRKNMDYFYNVPSTNLIEIRMADNVEYLGGNGFSNTLKNVIFSDNSKLKKLGEYCFSNTPKLYTMNIPIGLEVIGCEAFYYHDFNTLIKFDIKSLEQWLKLKFYSDGYEWITNRPHRDGNFELTVNGASPSNITIPETITEIHEYALNEAFSNCTLTIHSGVTSIAHSAFKRGGISKIIFEEGSQLESIGDYAFSDCYSLNDVVLPNSVGILGESAFKGCYYKLNSVTLSNSMVSIDKYTFSGCSGLTTLNISKSISNIYKSAFEGCSALRYINVDKDNKIFDSRNNCNAIIETKTNKIIKGSILTVIPDDVYTLGESSFISLNFRTFNIPKTIKHIEKNVFGGCNQLTSVTFDDGVEFETFDGSEMFYNCRYLSSITLPKCVKNLDESMFYYCYSLTSFTLNNTIENIYDKCFYYCTGLTSFTFESNSKLSNIGKSVFYNCNKLTSITIPDSVETIGDTAFQNCSGLTSIVIPSGVKTIGKSVFYGCNNLTDITFSENSVVEEINGTFSGCTYLTNISLPNTVKKLGDYSFYNCNKLTSITIPDSVETIGERVFYGCSGLTSIVIPKNVKSIGGYLIYNCTNLTNFAFEDDSQLEKIGDYAFYNCKTFTSFEIPKNVKEIGKNAFYGCSGLTSIVIPKNVEKIDDYAFANCKSLTSITFEEGSQLQSIGGYVFNGCSGLTSINLPENLITINNNAFNGCNTLTSVTMYDKVTTIGNYAFYGCSGLTSVNLSSGLTSIGTQAFYNCYSLTNVDIDSESQIETIGTSAFTNCSGLTSIVISSNVKTINNYAFYNCKSLNEIISYSVTAPVVSSYTFRNVGSNGIIKYPQGSDYSSWLSNSSYYLGYYNWTSQVI